MEVVPVGEDQEEFLPVDDELADKIMAVFDSEDVDELYEDEDDEDDE